MEIVEDFLGEGCGKFETYAKCGTWSLKHNEHYYCDECYKKYSQKTSNKNKEVKDNV
jgi:hypothetical protein